MLSQNMNTLAMPDSIEIIERLNGFMLGFNYYGPDLEYHNYEVNIYLFIIQLKLTWINE